MQNASPYYFKSALEVPRVTFIAYFASVFHPQLIQVPLQATTSNQPPSSRLPSPLRDVIAEEVAQAVPVAAHQQPVAMPVAHAPAMQPVAAPLTYAQVVETETYDVRAYVASPENTEEGVILNIPPYNSPEDISASLVNDRNPTILQARRMGKTNTVLIVFDGDQVPFNVYYRGAEYKCYQHKKRTEVCDKCGAVGHRSDVCPKPNAIICTLCGIANPATAHPCTLECLLCDQAHQTGDKTCPQRYQTPCLLIYRCQETAKFQQQRYLSTMISTQDPHPERQEVKPSDTRSCSPSPTSKRRGSRSRSKQRCMNQPQDLLLRSAVPEASDGPPFSSGNPVAPSPPLR
ncbi:hypothetical protein HPB51_002382 [Rhipicephalus microplus]|uniref:CCHC-type domain-containing protein n=1 Tax=Rhipicephalus microplus TaxID=6941 RepID=A0A9J6DSW0_RHIMP|nr:hypothetical protein HPB51_002382 [Rhipicephalus microplus]